MSNLRRAGALDGHPEWETALKEVDEDWNPSWSADWQRHYAALRELVAEEEGQAEVLPGVTVHGMDNGKWPARQRTPKVWQALTDGQRERLEQPGITPLAPAPEQPTRASTTFERAWRPSRSTEPAQGSVKVPRAHAELLEDRAEVRLGVWIMNQKTRRAKLATDKLPALAAPGLE
ncbi:helicase associated domain-containing protein [Streptomyces tremellae]|uniref:helicase associated domain-containing protein n=1 Tax=Streptomyces tremellae TaxID=1124239 RepID=UPI0031E8E5C4